MKVVFIITGLGMGGAETQVCNLADQLISNGHAVTLIYLFGDKVVSPKSELVKVIGLGLKFNPLSLVITLGKLMNVLRKIEPDVVHSHMVHANLLTRFTRLFINIPKLVSTAHSTNEGGWLRMKLYRLTEPLTDVFTNVSRQAVERFIKIGACSKDRIDLVYNGIDTSWFSKRISYKKTDNVFKFICIGRFAEPKDYPNLLVACKKLKQKHQDFHVSIVGDGPLRAKIESDILDYGLNENISLLGIRSDIPELLANHDVFVLPSKYEGFGLVVAEAMACEKYVIATDCGGVSEVCGKSGVLVPPSNPQALSDEMANVMTIDKSELSSTGARNRQHILENFALYKIVEQWISIYES